MIGQIKRRKKNELERKEFCCWYSWSYCYVGIIICEYVNFRNKDVGGGSKMNIEIITKKQMQIEVARVVDKKEFQMQRLINYLQKRILKLEEEMKILGIRK